MPVKKERQYRTAQPLQTRAEEQDGTTVEGYAATFGPYLFFEDEDGPVYESFSAAAFDNCDMSDVIMQYDHNGRVFARQSNGTLNLEIDDHGLKVIADLGSTEGSRGLLEDIRAGLITKMSWGFIPKDGPTYNTETRTIEWGPGSIRKIFDVSAVSIPANDGTEIAARKYMDGVIQKAEEVREKEERAQRRAELHRKILKIKLQEIREETNK